MKEFNLIPAEIRNLILCFNHWEDPTDFYTMSKSQRLLLLDKFKKVATQATKDNYWIWFGTYAKPNYQPRFHDEPVARSLYGQLVIAIPEGKRIHANGITTKSDVNPFRYTHKAGMTIAERFAAQKIHIEKTEGATMPDVQAALAELKEMFTPEAIDTKDMMRQVLTHNGHSEKASDEAIELASNLPWK